MARHPVRIATPRQSPVLLSLAFLASISLVAGDADGRPRPGEHVIPGRFVPAIYARTDPYIFTHNTALMTLQVTNLGILGNPFIAEISAGWRGGEYLFQAGLWIGAVGEDGEPHVSQSIAPNNVEFRPSLLPVDTIYESYEGIRGGSRRTEAFDADDDGDGLDDEDFRNGKDDDLDGLVDEDYAAVGQQMFACEYRDDAPEAVAQLGTHTPLGLKVRQRSFQWSTIGINEFTGFDFEVVNVGDQRLEDVHIGFFVDADAGPKTATNYWSDDLVGFTQLDTLPPLDGSAGGLCDRRRLRLDIAWIHDAPDNGTTVVGGDVPGWFGGLFLGHSTDPAGVRAPVRVGLTTVKWTSSSAPYPEGDPINDVERYDLLSRGGLPTRGVTRPDDYRFTLGAGPFLSLDPGERLSFQAAFVIGDGRDGMIENAINAQRVYDGRYLDADANLETGVEGRERCIVSADPRLPVMWDDPCDTLAVSTTFRGTVCAPGSFVNDDCDPCTGIDGRESLLNWVGTAAPPPPASNTDPGLFPGRPPTAPGAEIYLGAPGRDRQVTLQWDNASEIARDPISGRDLFEGYRVWRVDTWQRTEGSIGPTPEQWMLVGEFRKHPRDGLGSESPSSLRRVLRPERDAVKETTDFGPLYHIGRYEWTDERGVTNGRAYFYAVTAFGLLNRRNPTTGLLEAVELGGNPAAVQKELVVPSWGAGEGCDAVRVVPNPYRGGADWDLGASDCDPTGTKIAIRSLPADWTRLRIFSLGGDLVLEADPSDSRVVGTCETSAANRTAGTFYWDLITRSGQNVVSGIYLYVVESPAGGCRGRFVVIR